MKPYICRFCNELVYNAVHVRWCKYNPDLEKNRRNMSNKFDPKICSEIVKEAHRLGVYKNAHDKSRGKPGHPHTEETKKIISEKALLSNHRRLVKSCRKYICKNGLEILLDSSWEEALAKRLDYLKINWNRPIVPIKYLDNIGVTHNYFPDFYLVDYDLYLDPKNPEAYRQQSKKIEILLKLMPNLVIIKSLEECQNFIIPKGEK